MTIFYMYNPFTGYVIEKVLDQIMASVKSTPRPVVVIYVNPVMHPVLLERGFRVIRNTEYLRIYQWAPLGRVSVLEER